MQHPERHDRWTVITAAEQREGRTMFPQKTVFFTADMHNLWLGRQFLGATAFLVCGGPSAKDHLSKLEGIPGAVVVALNNAAQDFTPDIWIGLDEPKRFLNKIWLNPRIMKFTPLAYAENPLRGDTALTPRICSNVVFIRRNDHFNASRFLTEDTVNWGLDSDGSFPGGRSTMVAALRILHDLGFSTIILVGADFHMKEGSGAYSHDQAASEAAARRNNNLFHYLNTNLFPQLAPVLRDAGVTVQNAIVEGYTSGLTAFPTVSLEETIRDLRQSWADLAGESSAGLYDGHFAEDREKAPEPKPSPSKIPQAVKAKTPTPLDAIDAWRWTMGLEELLAVWDAFMQSRAHQADRFELRDRAYCVAGIMPMHDAWMPPEDTPVIRAYPHELDIADKTVNLVGRHDILLSQDGDSIDTADVVVRCGVVRMAVKGQIRLDITGSRTDIWVLDPNEKDILSQIPVILAKLEPTTVLIVLPPPNRPKQQRRFIEARYYVEKAGYPTVVHESMGLSAEAEALRALRRARQLTVYGVASHQGELTKTYWGSAIKPKNQPDKLEVVVVRNILHGYPNVDLAGAGMVPLNSEDIPDDRISSILHFVWVGSEPPSWLCGHIRQAAKTNPDADIFLWDDITGRILLEGYDLADAYDACTHQCQRADLIRYAALHMFGGVYVDADFWVVSDLSEFAHDPMGMWLVPHPPLKRFENLDLNNAILGARRAHPSLRAMLDECIHRFDNSIQPEWRARYGPVLVSYLAGRGELDYTRLPWSWFYPIHDFTTESIAKIKSNQLDDIYLAAKAQIPWDGEGNPRAIHIWEHFGVSGVSQKGTA